MAWDEGRGMCVSHTVCVCVCVHIQIHSGPFMFTWAGRPTPSSHPSPLPLHTHPLTALQAPVFLAGPWRLLHREKVWHLGSSLLPALQRQVEANSPSVPRRAGEVHSGPKRR